MQSPNDNWKNYTVNSSTIPVNFTGANTTVATLSWTYYQPPGDPSAPPAGDREPRKPLPSSWSGSAALEPPEGCP